MSFKRPNKKLGQHFLQDRNAVRRIVEAVGPRRGEPLLEIGPGRGAMTKDLLDAAGRMAAVELDSDLASVLRVRLASEGLLVLEDDILGVRFDDVLRRLDAPAASRLAIVGNLPYNISQPIAEKLVRERDSVDRAVLMFQREVAVRLTSAPGSRDYGPLGILAGTVYRIRSLFDLRPGAFLPPPRIVSTVTLWTPRSDSRLDVKLEEHLRACLSVCFARRRRTLRNNLLAAASEDARVDRLLDLLEIDGERRAETIEPETFLRMARHWNDWTHS